ncbi:aurora kinase A and ninein-interacting protein isoform X1 [Tachysurus ichikawai]
MKSCKNKTSRSPEEECGVWLDAAELRAKKQRNRTRPISKLLNPLARSGGYSVAVALNFTQTKMEMPVTKQSRISSFFPPQSKKGRDAKDFSSPWPSGMSSTLLPEAQMGTKRKREIFESPSKVDDVSRRSSLRHTQEHEDITSVSGEVCNDGDDDKEQQFLHLIWGYKSEECEPEGKRRPCENIKIDNITNAPAGSIKAMTCCNGSDNIPERLLHRDQTQQCSHESIGIRGEISNDTFLSTEDMNTQEPVKGQSETEMRALFLTPRSSTEVQNTIKHLIKTYKDPELFQQRIQGSPVKRVDKENGRHTSSRHSTALSPFKYRVCSSPTKPSSDFNRKLCLTPKKSIREDQENDEDSLGRLFTQDSEGFRVIAHRSKLSRLPLKDQTNSVEGREYLSIPSVIPLEMEENSDPGPEMLFTQDSQGNIVIKH